MATMNLRKGIGVLLASFLLALSGCGGGGGGVGGTTTTTGTTTSSSGATTTTTTSGTVTMAMTDPSTGVARNSLTFGSPVKVAATIKDSRNAPLRNAVVTFTSSKSDFVVFTPSDGSALTDSNGTATVMVDAKALTTAGAGSITASASIGTASASTGGSTVSGAINFTIGSTTVGLSGMTIGQTPLSAYGTTSVQVNVTGVPATTQVTVNFTSPCAASGKATLPASVLSVNGVATATYKDNGCGTTDRITASVTLGTSVSTYADLVISPPGVSSIQFVSATPTTIVLKGTGAAGMSENSAVIFKVVDTNNQPIAGANVTLDLTTRSGGILLDGSASAVVKQTDATGQVQVSVQSGTTPTPVWVTASVTTGGAAISTQSTQLTISTGRPAQDRFSLSVGTHNIEGWSRDGTTTTVTAIASDRMGNPVPNGTGINFVSSGGQVQSSCQTTNGRCSVTFTSANPRPDLGTDSEPSTAKVSNGRVVVMAYVLGEESFTDLNGNNVYDPGEYYNGLGNVYLDANESGSFQAATEQTVQYNAANASVCPVGIATSPSAPSVPNTCDGAWGAAHVRQTQIIVMSGSTAYIHNARPTPGYTPNTTYSMGGACETTVNFYLFDVNRNPMPAGTTLATGMVPTGISVTIGNPSVADTVSPGGTLHSAIIKSTNGTCGNNPPVGPVGGAFGVELKVTSPAGLVSSVGISLTP